LLSNVFGDGPFDPCDARTRWRRAELYSGGAEHFLDLKERRRWLPTAHIVLVLPRSS